MKKAVPPRCAFCGRKTTVKQMGLMWLCRRCCERMGLTF